ncbi:MAG TPA: glycosyltransferase, partial [Bacteroidia bacterium]|nr:glycosyltransferase [Bacteroidia bacterium]
MALHKTVNEPVSEIEPPVSIIICARNELKNLKANLQRVLEQDYPRYQVIVVNDCSWDESEKYLEELSATYKHLKIVSIKEQERYQHGKKFALTIGIKSALFDHLLLIDADCYPASNQWMRLMMQPYKQQTRIVIGYGAYIKSSSILNRWVRFDTAFNAMQYLSFALSGNPYMG